MGFFKRIIMYLLLKTSRQKQRYGTSIYNTRSGYQLYSNVVHYLTHTPKDVQVELLTVDGVYGLRATPPKKSSRVILYVYGGSFVLGLDHVKKAYAPFAARLAKAACAEVWIPSYRTAPEYSYPVQGDDCLANYLSLIHRGVNPQDISVMGAGSGAGLALALILNLRDKGLPLPGSVATISAWADLSLTAESHKTRADRDPMFNAHAVEGYFNHYMQGASPTDPLVSPYYGDYTGFPRMYMIVGGRELFYDDTIRVAQKAKDAGVDVTLDVNEDMVYGYPLYFDIYTEGRAAIDRLAAFVNETPAFALHTDPPLQKDRNG
jgi:acetyl esterase/lipase